MTEGEGETDILNRGIPRIAKNLAVRYARIPGIHIIVRRDRCKGCGACVKNRFCRFGAISATDRNVSIDEHRCRGCARCTHLCPFDALAIEVRPPPAVRNTLKHIDHRITKFLK